MENKVFNNFFSLKKSTMQQLKTLVLFMEENPELARGAPIFGANKFQVDEEWKKLCSNLNALGPPSRTIGEWKKTSADLKSRTKKKIGENQKSLRETGGGLYRYNNLTELEVIIDRTLFVSSAVAPGGKVFGAEDQSIDDCFVALLESPGRCSKSVAVVTPTRSSETSQQTNKTSTNQQKSPLNVHQSSKEQQQNTTAVTAATKRQESCFSEGENYPVASHSAKKGKFATEEINLIRRQLRIAEGNAATAAEQANSMKRMADAAEVQAEAAKRMANAAETTAAGIAELVKATIRFENMLEKHFSKS